MNKNEFIGFSGESEALIERLETLLSKRKWIVRWDYLEDITINNNINIEKITLILDVFKDNAIKDKHMFFNHICRASNKGYTVIDIIVSINAMLDFWKLEGDDNK